MYRDTTGVSKPRRIRGEDKKLETSQAKKIFHSPRK